MSFSDLIQHWKRQRGQAGQSPATAETLHDHPLGMIELTEAELEAPAGAAPKTLNLNCVKTYDTNCYTQKCPPTRNFMCQTKKAR